MAEIESSEEQIKVLYMYKLFSVNKQGGSTSTDFTSTRTLSQSFGGGSPQVDFTNANIRNTVLESQCPSVPQCFNSKYRKMDGSCNHGNSMFGKAKTALQRILEPAYSDGKIELIYEQAVLLVIVNFIGHKS